MDKNYDYTTFFSKYNNFKNFADIIKIIITFNKATFKT